MVELRKHMAVTMGASVGVMAVTFVTGVLTVHMLGPSGRGELAAVLIWGQTLGWAAAFGCGDAAVYLYSRRPEDGPSIVGMILTVGLVLGILGVIIAEILLPTAFRTQRPELIWMARLYTFSICLAVIGNAFSSLISGTQNFHLLNLQRVVQPTLYAVCLLGLWLCRHFTIGWVLAANVLNAVVMLTWVSVWILRNVGVTRPRWQLVKDGFIYGLKLQGASYGGLMNSRLDLMLMPSVLVSTQIGFYALAASVSMLVVTVVGSVNVIVFPAAARAGGRAGMIVVAKALRSVILISALCAGVLLLISSPFVTLIYGHKFAGSIPSLRILLPGVIFMSATQIVNSGLMASNRPVASSYAQLVGLVVTLVGLTLSLKPFGIIGAAMTSSVAYAATFFCALFLLSRNSDFDVREALSPREMFQDLLRLFQDGVRVLGIKDSTAIASVENINAVSASSGPDLSRGLRVSTLTASYGRPGVLRNYLDALMAQQRRPDQIVLVVRTTDAATIQTLRSYQSRSEITIVAVTEPGTVAALNAGLAAVTGDVVAIADDDTRPWREWIQRIEDHFRRETTIGALGGRDWIYNNGELEEGHAEAVGQIQWFGRIRANHHIGVGSARDVEFLKGANMSYRKAAIEGLAFDNRLRGKGAQSCEDLSFSLAVKRSKWRVIYDPEVGVDHHPVPRDDRECAGIRKGAPFLGDAIVDLAHNHTLALLDHLTPIRRIAFIIWTTSIGTNVIPGLVQAIRFTPTLGLVSWRRYLSAQQGIIMALMTWSTSKRRAPITTEPIVQDSEALIPDTPISFEPEPSVKLAPAEMESCGVKSV